MDRMTEGRGQKDRGQKEMGRDKFLQQVADYHIRKGTDMTRTTFVFPNRRSATFMRKYLQEGYNTPHFMPRMISITLFVQELNRSALASQTELMFVLYRAYCTVLTRHGKSDQIPDFDKFYFWGSIILNDFNDVDSYLVDADKLYLNLKELKEIRSYYLTDEQIEVVKYLWGDIYPDENIDKFWEHIPGGIDEEKPSAKYLHLWEIMGELYHEFIHQLDSCPIPLAYSGLQARRAHQVVKDLTADNFNGMRYVFVGFNALSTSRTLLFRRLKDIGVADFFWDVASPLVVNDKGTYTSSSRFIGPLSRSFPMPDDFELEPITTTPDIEIISVPSSFAQSKVVSEILKEWHPQEKTDADELVDTAIVMADEHLLMPMLYSVPTNISPINVTMGIPYSITPFAALMTSIISLHLRVRHRGDSWLYYYQDILDVLAHPHFTLILPEESRGITKYIHENHLYMISASELIEKYPATEFIFKQIENQQDIAEIGRYLKNLTTTLDQKLRDKLTAGSDDKYYELSLLEGYARAVDDLCQLIEEYKVAMHERTFLQMIERTMRQMPMAFAGKPLKGLQLMGMMDTRSLDFKNLIITSMNEGIYPRRNFNPSLIPAAMRHGYQLPTQEYDESSSAYQFYRLISRAEKVRILYDSREGGQASGEMSRYLSQLLHLNKDQHVKQRTVQLNVDQPETLPITIEKTPEVVAELKGYLTEGGPRLSASALKVYMSCPLKFYLQYVKKLSGEEETIDYIDAASYGSVIHSMAEHLYNAFRGRTITEGVLSTMLQADLDKLALQELDAQYYDSRYKDRLDTMPGEGQIVAKIIAQYVRKMLEKEKQLPPFEFVAAEFGEKVTHRWKVNDKYTINFTMSIDRIDRCPDPAEDGATMLRFIDYKSGGDATSFSDIDTLFESKDHGGIFQLLLYSNAYAELYGYDGKIKPIIYKLQEIPQKGIKDLSFNKKPLLDYRQMNAEGLDFRKRFEQLLDKIFETEGSYPFCQTSEIDKCRYCTFANMCHRYPEEKSYN